MAVAGTRQTRRRVVETGDDMNVLAERRQRVEAGSEFEIRSGLTWDPVFSRNAVAIEPENEAGLDPAGSYLARRRICGTVGVEHAFESRHADTDHGSGKAHPPQKSSPRNRFDCSHFSRPLLETAWRWQLQL